MIKMGNFNEISGANVAWSILSEERERKPISKSMLQEWLVR
jgi:hypothetical protein